jgi:hypothetical protein
LSTCKKTRFATVDIAFIGVFSAVWVALNLTLGPLGFAWFKLPIFCDFAVFFTLLLVTWLTGKFGAASLVGVIGSALILIMRGSPHIIGFAASAILFDMLMSAVHHKIYLKTYNMLFAAIAAIISAYFAGLIIGVFFMYKPLDWTTVEWALTFWGIWHMIGGIIGTVITLPIIGVLEKANVRKIKDGC